MFWSACFLVTGEMEENFSTCFFASVIWFAQLWCVYAACAEDERGCSQEGGKWLWYSSSP